MTQQLFLISRKEPGGYDTFDSAVVVAENAEQAKTIHPSGSDLDGPVLETPEPFDSWVGLADVVVELIGSAEPHFENGAVVCASFNAG